jgi:hypothetical protein
VGQGREADGGPIQHGVPSDPAIDAAGADNDAASGDGPASDLADHFVAADRPEWHGRGSERPGSGQPRFHGAARSWLARGASDLAGQFRRNRIFGAVDLRAGPISDGHEVRSGKDTHHGEPEQVVRQRAGDLRRIEACGDRANGVRHAGRGKRIR